MPRDLTDTAAQEHHAPSLARLAMYFLHHGRRRDANHGDDLIDYYVASLLAAAPQSRSLKNRRLPGSSMTVRVVNIRGVLVVVVDPAMMMSV